MEATKTFFGILAAVCALSAWAVGNEAFWHWAWPGGGLWQLVASFTTSVILPGVAICLFIDLTKRRGC